MPEPRRPSIAFLALVAVVLGAAITVRVVLLGRQSYWIDELFSVNESAGSLRNLFKLGSTEVHTPFYALLLWVWIRIGGSHEVWTRWLSTLFALLAVLVTYRGLGPVRLGTHIRWALTVATAASGISVVYSLETRSYALLFLGSVGLTLATLRTALLILDGEQLGRGQYLAWFGWSALAATAHLFGALLTLGAVAVLFVVTLLRERSAGLRPILIWAGLAAVACCLQAGWLIAGLARPDFASGTGWILAPRGRDVWELLTSTFGAGTLVAHKDGFVWTSSFGVIAAVALVLAATLYGHRRTRTPESDEGRSAAILLALAAVVIVAAFGGSQVTHLWTLRNMIIVAPALLWGMICLAAAAARTAAGRRYVATAAVALLGLALVPMAIGLSHPYKTDFRGLFSYLISERAQQPDVTYVFLGPPPPWSWRVASDRPDDDPAWNTLYRQVALHPLAAQNTLVRTPGPEVVIFYHGLTDSHLGLETSALIARLGPDDCRRVPIYGLGVVRCP